MNSNKYCVLLVDDDLTSLYLSDLTISRSGISAHTHKAEDAEEALSFVQANCHIDAIQELIELCPDIIFLDINMPGLDGFDFLERFRSFSDRVKKNIRIFMLTSSENPKDKERASQFGVHGYIVKPLTKEKFISVI
jgi:CheY-like chemotaxis protein